MSAAADIINYYDPYDLNIRWRRNLLLYTAGGAKSTVISQSACNVTIRTAAAGETGAARHVRVSVSGLQGRTPERLGVSLRSDGAAEQCRVHVPTPVDQ